MQRKQISTILRSMIFLVFVGSTDNRVSAYIITNCHPVCPDTAQNGSGVFFRGGCDLLTFGSCQNSMEYGSGQIYTFLDQLPCDNNCDSIGNNLDCTNWSMINEYMPYKYKLVLGGDVGTKFNVHGSSSGFGYTFTNSGTFDVSSLSQITISSSRKKIKEGEVDFTYLITARDYECNDECTCRFDTLELQLSVENCNCSSTEIPLFVVHDSFRVIENERVDFDPFNIVFSPADTATGNSAFMPINYCAADYPFSHTYNEGAWNSQACTCEANGATVHWLIDQDQVTFRVKVPAWQENVWACGDSLPYYMSAEGWGCDVENRLLSLYMEGLGIIWIHHDTLSNTSGPTESYLPSAVEYCTSGQAVGQGTILWTYAYVDDASGNRHLSYIYNGTDPNNPENSPRYYKMTWGQDYGSVKQEYFNTTKDASNPLRVWQASFDSKGRVIEMSSGGCSSGCAGTAFAYKRVEYTDDFDRYDDLVAKTYNADGDIVLETEYQSLSYGDYWPQYSLPATNSGFELPDAADGAAVTGIPTLWSATEDDPNLVSVFDPNDAQMSTRYDTGEVIPDGDQVLTLMDSSAQQIVRSPGIVASTTYFIGADVAAINNPNTSSAKITLLAYDPHDPNELSQELIVVDVSEGSQPEGFGVQLDEGKWVTQEAFWSSSVEPEFVGWGFKIIVEGNYVDVDRVSVSALTYLGGKTRPLVVKEMASPIAPGDPNVVFVTWQYDSNNSTAVERRWVDSDNARVTKYGYSDDSFSTITSKTVYNLLNDDPSSPAGAAYTTHYATDDANGLDCITYPSGKRMDVNELNNGQVKRSYSRDVVSGKIANLQEYTYDGDYIRTHTDARGGVTTYTYESDLLQEQRDPATTAGQQVTEYEYDGAHRMIREWRKDTDGDWVKTSYTYNDSTGFLDRVVSDDDQDDEELHGPKTGLKEATEYKYNDFGQVIREKRPDGSVAGKSYGLGGELTSEFVLADPEEIDETTPDVVSQTLYYYDSDGRIEYVKKVKATEAFSLCDPNNMPQGTELVTTQYEYDFLGRKIAVTEDLDGLALKTTYEYNNQGEITKTTLPNGRWTETVRDGRGLVKMQTVGHANLDQGEWQVTLFYYDANGNLKEKVGPDGVSTLYEHDNFDRLVKVKRGVTN